MEDVLRAVPMGQGHHDDLVHAVPDQVTQLADPRVVGPIAPTHGQRALVDPADVPAFDGSVARDAAADRDAGGAEGGLLGGRLGAPLRLAHVAEDNPPIDRKSTRLNSSHDQISYAV